MEWVSARPEVEAGDVAVCSVADVAVYADSSTPVATGLLTVTHSRLVFWADGAQTGLEIEYPRILLHAISRGDPDSAFGPCIYASVLVGDDVEGGDTAGLRFAPPDEAQLADIYGALSECQALHPDEEEEEEGEAAGGMAFGGLGAAGMGDGVMPFDPASFGGVTAEDLLGGDRVPTELTEEGQVLLERFEQMLAVSAQNGGGAAAAGDQGDGDDDGGVFEDAD